MGFEKVKDKYPEYTKMRCELLKKSKQEYVMRNCLHCDKPFPSVSKYNRCCDECKRTWKYATNQHND